MQWRTLESLSIHKFPRNFYGQRVVGWSMEIGRRREQKTKTASHHRVCAKRIKFVRKQYNVHSISSIKLKKNKYFK